MPPTRRKLRLSKNLGRYNEAHPAVKSDREEIRDLRGRIHEQLKSALDGIDVQLEDRARHYNHLDGLVGPEYNRSEDQPLTDVQKAANKQLAKSLRYGMAYIYRIIIPPTKGVVINFIQVRG